MSIRDHVVKVVEHFFDPPHMNNPIWFDVTAGGCVLDVSEYGKPRPALQSTQAMYDSIVRTGQFAGTKYADLGKREAPEWVQRGASASASLCLGSPNGEHWRDNQDNCHCCGVDLAGWC